MVKYKWDFTHLGTSKGELLKKKCTTHIMGGSVLHLVGEKKAFYPSSILFLCVRARACACAQFFYYVKPSFASQGLKGTG
jgi:hypothetical protein